PDPRDEELLMVPLDPEILEIPDRLLPPGSRQPAFEVEPSQHVKHLDIEQGGRVERPAPRSEELRLDRARARGTEQEVGHDRRVDNDHGSSRRSRITSAADRVDLTSDLARNLSSNSSGAGFSPIRLISRSRYSESDIPAMAALDFNLRCSESGTFRI
ncbi:MAG: hypothetical protein LC732_04090, partial [Acidobacteria bacterium]|nr:hypothetical protein [Acidobacteriota bacterium]